MSTIAFEDGRAHEQMGPAFLVLEYGMEIGLFGVRLVRVRAHVA